MKAFMSLYNQAKERLEDLGLIHWVAYILRHSNFSEKVLRKNIKKIMKQDGVLLKPKELDEVLLEIKRISHNPFLDEKRKHRFY